MVGLELPVLAMEHQYLITEDLPEFAGQKEQLHCIDFEGEIYMRQERGGMLLGTYERAGVPWSPRTTPWDFGQDLLPNDLERIAPSLRSGLRALSAAGQCRHPQGGQRPVHLRSGWQSAARPGARARQLLGGVRRHGRLQPGRRCRAGAGALDGRWRSRRRHLGHGRGALRRLGHACLHQCQGARELFPALSHPVSKRGAGRGAAAAHHAHLRATAVAKTPCSANTAGSSTRCGSHPRAARRTRRSASGAPTRMRWSARNAARCARRSGCWRSPTTASSRSAGRPRPPGCRPSWPIVFRPSVASR